MNSRVALLLAVLTVGALSAAGASAAAPPSCATTTDPLTAATPSPGNLCWTDVTPYPFGVDGGPVDPTSPACQTPNPGPSWSGDPTSCYLTVDSMAFRAWNRGLAATHGTSATAGYVVWLFNGTRWYPDPTFPGRAACPGNTVLWAGKLDYWLIGRRRNDPTSWPALCRFDGSRFEWQTLQIPPATLARVPVDSQGQPMSGTITSGSCFSWDNCWFFGNYGTAMHWDGQQLSDASPGLGASPWLAGGFTAAVAGTDGAGNPFGFAVSDTGPSDTAGAQAGQQVPSQPDGSAPPQLWTSSGGAFSPLAFSPETDPLPGDPYRTDVVGVGADGRGDVWVAGDPIGARPPGVGGARVSPATQTAPLSLVSASGSPESCPPYDGPTTFTFTPSVSGSYSWSALSVFQSTGDALAGGSFDNPTTGTNPNNTQGSEPVLVIAECGRVPATTLFRIPDPFDPNQAGAALVPADATGGYSTAVAANADNDAWAATNGGSLVSPFGSPENERPHVYRLTDGRAPDAPAGDDNEKRPLVFVSGPTVYVTSPAVTITTPPPPTPIPVQPKPRQIHLKAAIYKIHIKVTHGNLTGGVRATYVLHIIFRVRRPLTIGAEGLLHGKVVTSSGMHRFTRGTGELRLKLDRKHWPKQIKFVFPRAKK